MLGKSCSVAVSRALQELCAPVAAQFSDTPCLISLWGSEERQRQPCPRQAEERWTPLCLRSKRPANPQPRRHCDNFSETVSSEVRHDDSHSVQIPMVVWAPMRSSRSWLTVGHQVAVHKRQTAGSDMLITLE